MIAFTCPISQSRSPSWKWMLVLLLTYSSSYFLPNRDMADPEQCRGGRRDGQSDLAGRLLLKLTQFSLGIKVSLDENRANFRASEMVLALPHPPPHIPCSFKPFLQSSVQRVPGGDCPDLPILLLDALGGGVELPYNPWVLVSSWMCLNCAVHIKVFIREAPPGNGSCFLTSGHGTFTSAGDNVANHVAFTCFPSVLFKVLWSGVQEKQGNSLVYLHV